ncbi:MAG TPA: DUF3313 family protein [Caldimonas sp.]|nr:DUF3313 family protein [Caldimonas sp.]
MTMSHTLKAAGVLALTVALTSVPAATKKEIDQALSHGGLEKITVKDIDLAYARPGASLAAYKRVKLERVEVEFRKAKDPARAGSAIRLSSEERERIRSNVSRVVQEEFAKELQKGSIYQVASDAGVDVLRVKPRILDLYVNAPDVGQGRSRTLVSSAGEMTLVAELADSVSGKVLARVADQRDASKEGRMYLVNGTVNEEEARKIAAGWARILRRALDNAHGIGS